jgi:hypothetical protein
MGGSGASRVREGALLVLKEIHRISAKEALLKKNDVESLARAAVARGGGQPRRVVSWLPRYMLAEPSIREPIVRAPSRTSLGPSRRSTIWWRAARGRST